MGGSARGCPARSRHSGRALEDHDLPPLPRRPEHQDQGRDASPTGDPASKAIQVIAGWSRPTCSSLDRTQYILAEQHQVALLDRPVRARGSRTTAASSSEPLAACGKVVMERVRRCLVYLGDRLLNPAPGVLHHRPERHAAIPWPASPGPCDRESRRRACIETSALVVVEGVVGSRETRGSGAAG